MRDLNPLIRPKSIAIVGASDKPSIGRNLLSSLKDIGFGGPVYPINPRYESILGTPCYPSLESISTAPDLVAFCISGPRILDTFRSLPKLGIRAAVIYDGGFAERGEDGRRLQDEIDAICREGGVALCGPNCMGILNPWERSTTYLHEIIDASHLRGNVGIVSQSGSMCIALVNDVRRYGFSAVISSGNEASVTTADYINYLVDDERTRVIATFTESIKDPKSFASALERASEARKPVVVLKVGRNERTRRAISSHTGGLAGEAGVFSAMLRHYGAIEVDDLDELAEVLAACQGRVWPSGRRIVVVSGSGGQSELILDQATAAGIEMLPLHPGERQAIEKVVGHVSGDGNPIDVWGNGDFNANLAHALTVLRSSANHDAIVLVNDISDEPPAGNVDRTVAWAAIARDSSLVSAVPHFIMTTRTGVMNSKATRTFSADGMALVSGVRTGLGAIDVLGRYGEGLKPVKISGDRVGKTIADLARGAGRASIHEADAKLLLGSYGVTCCRERRVSTLGEAHAAADASGYPVVMKVLSDDIPHKSEHGLIAVGLRDGDELSRSWSAMADRVAGMGLAPQQFLVQEMVKGYELFAGVSTDPDFGKVLAFGIGGVDIEEKKEFVLRLLPLREGDAEAMIAEIRGGQLLAPGRRRPAVDARQLAGCLYAVSDYAMAESGNVAEIDLNPIKITASGACVCVDALIIPAAVSR